MKHFRFTMVSSFTLNLMVKAVDRLDAKQEAETLTNGVFKSVLHHQSGKTRYLKPMRVTKERFNVVASLEFINVRKVDAESEAQARSKITKFFKDEYALVSNHLTDTPIVAIYEITDHARVEDPSLLSI